MALLGDDGVRAALTELPAWSGDATKVECSVEAPDFLTGIRIVEDAERADLVGSQPLVLQLLGDPRRRSALLKRPHQGRQARRRPLVEALHGPVEVQPAQRAKDGSPMASAWGKRPKSNEQPPTGASDQIRLLPLQHGRITPERELL